MSSNNNNKNKRSSKSSSMSPTRYTRSLLETLMDRDQKTAFFYSSQIANNKRGAQWIERTLSQVLTDSARVDASGEPPVKGSEFNHEELEEIDVNLFRAKKEDLW
jgi:hypothetical protein